MSVLRILKAACLPLIPFATSALADIAPVPVPFTGACYCHAACLAPADGGEGIRSTFSRYRVDFNVGAQANVRDDELATAAAQCQKAAKETKFPSDLSAGEKTPEELLKSYCVGGGKAAPACPSGCATIQCGARQYER